MSSTAITFYNLPEMVEHMLTFCNLHTLVRWSQTHHAGRNAVAWAKTRQLHILLRRFVHKEVPLFLRMLEDHEAVVVGSMGLALVTPDTGWVPQSLTVVVPRKEGRAFLELFRALGYVLLNVEMSGKKAREEGCLRVCALRHNRNKTSITLAESFTHSIFPPVLCRSTTAAMNIVTGSTIYSMYPVLTSKNRALEAYRGASVATIIDLFLKRVLCARDTNAYREPCGLACPGILRRTRGLCGVGRVRWIDGDVYESGSDYVEGLSYQWSLSHGCVNEWCPFNAGVLE